MLARTQRGCCAPAAAAPPAASTTSRASRTDSAPDYPANHTTNTSLAIAPPHLDTNNLGALARRSESTKDGRETERGSHYSEASSGSCRQSELARSLRTGCARQVATNHRSNEKQHQSSKLSEASQVQKTTIWRFQIGGCVPNASGASRRSAAAARGSGAPPSTPAGSGAKSPATAPRGKAASGLPEMAATGWARPEIAATRTCPARHACRKHRAPTIRERLPRRKRLVVFSSKTILR